MNSSVKFVQNCLKNNQTTSFKDLLLLLVGKCYDTKEVMDGISEYVFVKGEAGLSVKNAEWGEIKEWMVKNWSQEPEFVSNAIWLIYHGHMTELAFRIKEASRCENDDMKHEALMIIEQWNEIYADPI